MARFLKDISGRRFFLSAFTALIFVVSGLGAIAGVSMAADEAVKPPAAAPAKGVSAAGEKLLINFVDVDIVTFVNFISKMTGKNFVYDEKLVGKVTIVAPSKLTVDEAFDLFTSVLELKGYSTVYTGTAYKIVPAAGVKQGPVGFSRDDKGFRLNDAYIGRLIQLSYVQAADMVPTLQPLVSKEGYVSAFSKTNALLVIDNALNLDKIVNIVKLIDVEAKSYSPEIVYLKNTQAESILLTLKQIKSGGRGRSTPTPPAGAQSSSAELQGAVADKRLNAMILFGPPEENQDYKRLISSIDIPSPEMSSRINVYYLENAEAAELSKVLDGLIKPAQSAPGAQTVTSELSGKVLITPDKATNALIIMASPEDYQNILQVIKKLDRRPRQVFVEAMITEVSINKSLDLGSKWRASGTDSSGNPVAIGGVGTIDSSSLSSILTGMAGFTLGGASNFISVPVTNADGTTSTLSAPGFAALFSLSDFRGVVDVLSTPHILTSDNKEAEIIVGENVPFISKFEQSSSTTNTAAIQSIERKDVGITLRIKPQISEGDYIKLDIYQEISALTSTTLSTADVVTTKRSAKTSVVVKDKQTVVIGGLIQDKNTKDSTKMPWLGDLPVIGWLFKSTSNIKEKTNLLVYITPTIVRDFENLDSLRQKKEEEFKSKSASKDDGKDASEDETKDGTKGAPEPKK